MTLCESAPLKKQNRSFGLWRDPDSVLFRPSLPDRAAQSRGAGRRQPAERQEADGGADALPAQRQLHVPPTTAPWKQGPSTASDTVTGSPAHTEHPQSPVRYRGTTLHPLNHTIQRQFNLPSSHWCEVSCFFFTLYPLPRNLKKASAESQSHLLAV